MAKKTAEKKPTPDNEKAKNENWVEVSTLEELKNALASEENAPENRDGSENAGKSGKKSGKSSVGGKKKKSGSKKSGKNAPKQSQNRGADGRFVKGSEAAPAEVNDDLNGRQSRGVTEPQRDGGKSRKTKISGKARSSDGRFVKGVSGNPGGRPRKSDRLLEMGYYAEEKIFEMMQNPKTPRGQRIDLYKYVHDKAFGRATQAVDVEGKGGINVSTSIRFEGALDEWSE